LVVPPTAAVTVKLVAPAGVEVDVVMVRVAVFDVGPSFVNATVVGNEEVAPVGNTEVMLRPTARSAFSDMVTVTVKVALPAVP
jgi:hypothetical protein